MKEEVQQSAQSLGRGECSEHRLLSSPLLVWVVLQNRGEGSFEKENTGGQEHTDGRL